MLKKIVYIYHPIVIWLLVSCSVIAFFIVFDGNYRIAKGHFDVDFKGVVIKKYIDRNTHTMLVIQATDGISETENIERILLGKSGVERIVYIPYQIETFYKSIHIGDSLVKNEGFFTLHRYRTSIFHDSVDYPSYGKRFKPKK